MSRVLVTGAAGNIGRAVTLRLLADGRPELRASEQREMDRVRDARERALGASGLRRRARRFSVVLAIALIGAAAVNAPSSAAQLQTAITDPLTFSGPDRDLAFARTADAGASAAEIQIRWNAVAPKTRPATFNPSNPNDPGYDWASIDTQVLAAKRQRLEPLLAITDSPTWSQTTPSVPNYSPSPSQFAAFAQAAARRYSGAFAGLPRVRYWIAWNEPNLSSFLTPQQNNVSANIYRALLNAFASAVKAVHQDNQVVAGQLDPVASHAAGYRAIAPIPFIRALLCMSGGARPHPTCTARARFDIWSYHPYTSGGPFDRARVPGDAMLGDLQSCDQLLRAAQAAHHVVSSHRIGFWVTEFAWDSNPPSPHAVPMGLLTRWVAEALYQMWRSDVTLATWYLLRGTPGLYFAGPTLAQDQPKPTVAAFRFPFVAYRTARRINVWGRTPGGERGNVVIEQAARGHWVRRRLLQTHGGIFRGQFLIPASARGSIRASLSGSQDHSPPFSLTRPRDLFVNPFG